MCHLHVCYTLIFVDPTLLSEIHARAILDNITRIDFFLKIPILISHSEGIMVNFTKSMPRIRYSRIYKIIFYATYLYISSLLHFISNSIVFALPFGYRRVHAKYILRPFSELEIKFQRRQCQNSFSRNSFNFH